MSGNLQEIVDFWKQRLGLHSWEITIKEVRRHEQELCAETYVKPQMERANITVWRECDRLETDDNVELDILHELVHIRLWSIDPYDATGVHTHCREAAIEWLARALYDGSPFQHEEGEVRE